MSINIYDYKLENKYFSNLYVISNVNLRYILALFSLIKNIIY